jgi:DNA-binding PadR family transcriptional regulator
MARPKSTTVSPTELKSVEEHSKIFRDLLLGFVRIHVLYHASREPIFGVGITAELDRHGYKLSPGTLYPLLHNLEAAEFLVRENQIVGGKIRKYYRVTPLGKRALEEARSKAIDLVNEVTQDEPSQKRPRAAAAGPRRRRTS